MASMRLPRESFVAARNPASAGCSMNFMVSVNTTPPTLDSKVCSNRDLLQQPRQHPIRQRLSARLTGRTVLKSRIRVDHLANRVTAHRARQAGSSVHPEVRLLLTLELGGRESFLAI